MLLTKRVPGANLTAVLKRAPLKIKTRLKYFAMSIAVVTVVLAVAKTIGAFVVAGVAGTKKANVSPSFTSP